jgi:hypothetical protein
MKRLIAMMICVALGAPACAASQGPRVQTAPTVLASTADRQVLAEFVGGLALGSRVKATVTGNKTVRGTLVKRTENALMLQTRTRVPEPLVEIRYTDLLSIEPETTSGTTGRAIAIGVAVGVGAAVGTLMILAAALSGS